LFFLFSFLRELAMNQPFNSHTRLQFVDMVWKKIAQGGLILAVIISLFVSGGGNTPAVMASSANFAAGTLIIPMDATYQDYGMFKAYGLVYKLLNSGIPVHWAIGAPKTPDSFGGVDFGATTVDARTLAAIGSYNYSGGPFVIDSANAAAAQTIINAWWAANGNQPVVHRATAGFTANISIVLKRAPRIALESVNSKIAIAYFNAAGIPDSSGNVWSSTSPNILSQTMIACNSATGCTGDTVVGNGALFTNGACSSRKYDTFVTPHNGGYSYSLTDPANLGTQVYAELDYFTFQGGGWTALCHSILSNENNINDLYRNGAAAVRALFKSTAPGGMLTQFGFPAIANTGGTWTVNRPDLPVTQAVPTSGAVQSLPGGSVQTWQAPDGTANTVQYWSSVERAAYFLNNGRQYDWAINGPYHNGTGRGKITFLGGHSYSTSLPYSSNSEAPYLRFFYNSLFFNGDVANFGLVTTPATLPQGNTRTIQIATTNTGSMDAINMGPVTITLQAGVTYLSTSGIQPTSIAPGNGGTTILSYPAPGLVAAGASPIIVNASVFSAATGTVKVASVSAAYGDAFGEAFTSQDCTSVTFASAPGAALTKEPASQGPVNVGAAVTWTLTYRNPGGGNLLNPYVEDILPSAFTYLSATPAPTYVIPQAGGTRLRWNLTSPLAAGGSGSITLRATVQTAANQPFTNNATFAGSDSSGTVYSASAAATVSVTAPNATLAKSVDTTGGVATGATLTYTLKPSSPGPTLFSGVRFFDAPPLNTTYVNNSVTPSTLGTFGTYPRITGVDGSDTNPTTTLNLSEGVSPFTYALGSTLTVTMALTNANGNSGPITNVTASLTPSDGASTCVPLSAQPVASIAVNSTANLTFTCTIGSTSEITWDGDASGTYASQPYDFPTGTSPSVLGVPTTTGTNVVQWIPTLNTSNTEAVPSVSFSAGTGPGLFAFNGSTAIWERYDIPSNAWITSPTGLTNNLPAASGAGAALVYDGNTYANGYIYGLRGAGTNTFWRYKLSNGTGGSWSALPPAAAPWNVGAGGALARLGNFIYALQGNSTTGFARYDTTTNTWTTLRDVPAAVGSGGALATDGTYIYALRGAGQKNFYRYDPAANTWAAMANAPWAVNSGGSLTAVGTTLYALRGNNSNNFASFTPNATTGVWTRLGNAPGKIGAGGSLATSGGYLYALRGANSTSVYRYNLTSRTWATMKGTLANITTGAALIDLPGSTGASNSNTLSAPTLVTGSNGSRTTIQIVQTITASAAVSGVTASQLTVVSSMARPASGTPVAGCTVNPATQQNIAAGGSLTFTWTCTDVYQSGGNNDNQNLGMLTFSAGASGTTPATIWAPATSNSVLVTQPLTYQVTVNTTPTTFNQVSNQALLSDNLAFAQGVGSNTVVNDVTRPPNLVVTKTVNPASGTQVSLGNTLTYSLLVQNTSPGAATSVSVTDSIPTNTSYSSCTTTMGTCTRLGGTVTYSVGSLAGYGTATLTMVVQASLPAAAGLYTIPNYASFTYNGTGGPFSGTSNSVSNPLLIPPAVTISKAESVSPTPDGNGRITPGSTITYTMIVNNPSGAVPATGVVATDVVPSGTSYISCASSLGSCAQSGGTVMYTLGNMAANSSATLTLVVNVGNPAEDGGTISNVATVSAATNITGTTYTASSNLVSYQISAAPTISIQKSSSPASGTVVKTGDIITYTLVVKNTGNANTNTAYVQDAIPANTAYVPNSTTINGLPYPEVTPGVAPVQGGMKVFSPGYGDVSGDGGTLLSQNGPGGAANDATVTFQVIVTSPAGIAASIVNTAAAGTASTARAASNATSHTTPVSIGNALWVDENANGLPDAGEHGIANARINLLDSIGNTIAITYTDSNGQYLFTNVPVGAYTVAVDVSTLPAGLAYPTYDADGLATPNQSAVSVALGSGTDMAINFGYNWASMDNVTGNTGTGAIGDRVWVDSNGNGLQDPGEIGLAGLPVELKTAGPDGLFGTSDDVTAAVTTTGADGSYFFASLAAGAYQVIINGGANPAGYVQSYDPDGSVKDNETTQPIVLAPGDVYLNTDFGYQPSGASSSIGNTIYRDLNANGIQDGGEGGIAGVTVALVRESGDPGNWNPATEPIIATAVTDASGNYNFTGLPAGNYLVIVLDNNNVLSGLRQSGDPDGVLNNRTAITADGSSTYNTANFGYTPLKMSNGAGLIGDQIYLDRNGDGVFTAGEGLEGVQVSLYAYDGITLLARGATNANGSYAFGGLPDGNYQVVVEGATLPAGINNTQFPAGGSTNHSGLVVLSGGSVNMAQDFGYQGGNTISGTIWNDLNADGHLDAAESTPWPRGITLNLLDASGRIVDTTTTDVSGNYSFAYVPDGTFQVNVTDTGNVLNDYWHSIGANPGQDNNSQADLYPVTVSGGQTNSTADFGYYIQAASVGNWIWWDINRNGIQDSGENGLEGVMVTLTITNPDASTTTLQAVSDSNGHYGFENLLSDESFTGTNQPSFVISIAIPQGYLASPVHQGSDPALDSSDPAGEPFTVTRGTINANLSADFGLFPIPTGVDLNYFRAARSAEGVLLTWETVNEATLAGFNLYRREPGGEFAQINAELIPPAKAGQPEGSAYTYLDEDAQLDLRYEYRLEAIENTLAVGSTALVNYYPYALMLPVVVR
jgi:uncharacterized repeat protein (TIGR01451 family)